MKKTGWLKLVNILLFICALSQIATGLSHEILNPEIFTIMHSAGGIFFAILAVAHVILNWAWVRAGFFK